MNYFFKALPAWCMAGIICSCGNNNTQPGDNISGTTAVTTAGAGSPAAGYMADIEKAAWLLGSWKNTIGNGYSVEDWTKVNDSTYQGLSYMVAGKDTLSSEKVSLQQRGTALYYIPTVKGQNDDNPVPFTLTNTAGDKLVFENPKHDFPQKITYTKIAADSMVAEISGMENGKANTQQFPMKRIK